MSRRFGKCYGDTVVDGNARVQLGDISNVSHDVNVQGGLHLHFHPRLGEIAEATTIIEFLQVCKDLVALDSARVKGKIKDHNLAEALEQCLRWLRHVLNRLRRVCRTGELADDAFSNQTVWHAIFADACQDAERVTKALNPLFGYFDSKPEAPPFPSLHKPRDLDVDEENPYQAARSYRERESELQRIWITWLQQMKTMFMLVWNEQKLAYMLTSCLEQRNSLAESLISVVNGHKNAPKSPARGQDVVEILSVLGSVDTGLQSLGAVFTSANGQSQWIPSSSSDHLISSEQEMAVIKYDLRDGAKNTTQHGDRLIAPIANFVQSIKTKLSFREDHMRRIDIKEAHERTFGWIFDESNQGPTSRLRTWLPAEETLFWVNGKAGSGKSTLMKFIYQNPQLSKLLDKWAAGRQLVTGSFYLWKPGHALQKSYEGVLRSLLHQILDARPDLAALIFPELFSYCLRHTTALDAEKSVGISVQELREAFKLLMQKIPENVAVFLLIDGIDEYHGDYLEFAKFLVECASCASLKLLVSSRPIPACVQLFSKFPKLRLQDLTEPDIRAYVEAELLQNELLLDMECLEPGFSAEVKAALLEKASGVFLWIYLVVGALVKGLGEYDRRQTLMHKIDAIPNDLEDLYDSMFAKMSTEHRQEGSLLIQLIVRATEAQDLTLTALQLYTAEKRHYDQSADDDETEVLTGEHENLRIKTIDGKLRSRCCGLVEVKYSTVYDYLETPKVSYLHRTVFDYLREPSVWEKIKEAGKVSSSQIDLLLLASCVFQLRWLKPSTSEYQIFFDDVAYDYWSHILNQDAMNQPKTDRSDPGFEVAFHKTMTACLEYSYRLSCSKDDRYVVFLKAADSLFRNHLSKKDPPSHKPEVSTYEFQSLSNPFTESLEELSPNNPTAVSSKDWSSTEHFAARLYQELANSFVVRREYNASITPNFEQELDLDVLTISMLMFARLGFAAYFAYQLRARFFDPAKKSLLLLHILILSASSHLPPKLARAHARMFKSLLDHGVDPKVSIGVSHCAKVRSLLSSEYGEVTQVNPWNFWIRQPMAQVRHLYVSTCFFQLHASSKRNRAIDPHQALWEAELHSSLHSLKRNGFCLGKADMAYNLDPLPQPKQTSTSSSMSQKRVRDDDEQHMSRKKAIRRLKLTLNKNNPVEHDKADRLWREALASIPALDVINSNEPA